MAQEPPSAVLSLIGQPRYEVIADNVVNADNIRAMCAAVENTNSAYWSQESAVELHGAVFAPASMLSTWARHELWSPGGGDSVKPLQLHFDLKELFGFPTAIVSSFESVFYTPAMLGDKVRSWQILQSVSVEKKTRLGTGRFWVIEMQYYNQCDEPLGVDSFNCFGYRRCIS